MVTTFIATLWYLLVGHFVADYPLQTDFLAKGKSPEATPGPVPWQYIMAAHAAVHGLMVSTCAGLILGPLSLLAVLLGALELVLHFYIDVVKCKDQIDIHVDQALHVICKTAWAAVLALSVARDASDIQAPLLIVYMFAVLLFLGLLYLVALAARCV